MFARHRVYGRNHPRDCYMVVRRIYFWSKYLVASFRVVGVALCDIQMCFVTCRKLFCVAGVLL